MKTLIVTGGKITHSFVASYMDRHQFNHVIAADSGIHFFAATGRLPDEVLGDFDSADQTEVRRFEQHPQIRFHQFCPEKDATDTELALELALERGSDEIHILGGSGTRLDHLLGTIHLLGLALEQGVPCYLVDEHNRLRLIREKTVLRRADQYGDFVSLIPLTTRAEGVTLTGFKYPLKDYQMDTFHSIGISNEIISEEAVIELKSVILVLAETRD